MLFLDLCSEAEVKFCCEKIYCCFAFFDGHKSELWIWLIYVWIFNCRTNQRKQKKKSKWVADAQEDLAFMTRITISEKTTTNQQSTVWTKSIIHVHHRSCSDTQSHQQFLHHVPDSFQLQLMTLLKKIWNSPEIVHRAQSKKKLFSISVLLAEALNLSHLSTVRLVLLRNNKSKKSKQQRNIINFYRYFKNINIWISFIFARGEFASRHPWKIEVCPLNFWLITNKLILK